MTALELKEYIIKNDKIILILESLGCHKIHINSLDIRCALPNHNNPNSLSVKKETLKVTSYDESIDFVGDIFTLVMKIRKINFPDSLKWICSILNIPFTKDYKIQKNTSGLCDIFLKAKKIAQSKSYQEEEMEVFNSIDIEEYVPLPHVDWIRDGIYPRACERFAIGYDLKSRRIIIPHRLWCGDSNDFVGIMGRTTLKNWELLGIPKYKSMRNERYPKTMNIYGLNENYQDIHSQGYVTVFEAEKSVLKRYTFGDKTGVAVCGHSISKEQEKILISLDTDIVIAMDRGISKYAVRELCEQFYNIRRVYYLWDTYDCMLKDKESPADLPDKLYNIMFQYKIPYDSKEHEEYIREKVFREEEKSRLERTNR